MNHHVEITITADIPDDQKDAGHEAIVATKEAVQAIAKQFEGLGLKNVQHQRRLFKTKTQKAVVAAVQEEASEGVVT